MSISCNTFVSRAVILVILLFLKNLRDQSSTVITLQKISLARFSNLVYNLFFQGDNMRSDLGIVMILISLLMMLGVVGSIDNMLPHSKFQDVVMLMTIGFVAFAVGLLGYSYLIAE
jgi:hypothetical protein